MLQLRADTTGINSSHIIHRVSFGPMYPGQVNPLDGGALSVLCALFTMFQKHHHFPSHVLLHFPLHVRSTTLLVVRTAINWQG